MIRTLRDFLEEVFPKKRDRFKNQSPFTNIVPMPLSDKVSTKMECATLPSMMNTFFTPRRIASLQQSIFGIIPPEMIPCLTSEGMSLT